MTDEQKKVADELLKEISTKNGEEKKQAIQNYRTFMDACDVASKLDRKK